MKISIYTSVKNGIENDFHVEAMLKHHAPLVDEIIVNEGYSTDGTYERIREISGNNRAIVERQVFIELVILPIVRKQLKEQPRWS